MYKFGEARILAGLPPGLGDDQRWTMVMLSSHDEEMAMQQRFPEWNRTHTFRAMPHRFARLIAKIGHGYGTAELGFGTFTPLTTDLILGRSDDYYFYVGGSWDIDAAIPGGNHHQHQFPVYKLAHGLGRGRHTAILCGRDSQLPRGCRRD